GSARVAWSGTPRARLAATASWPAASGSRAASGPAGPVPRPARDRSEPRSRPAPRPPPPRRSRHRPLLPRSPGLLVKPRRDDAGDPGAGLAVPQRRQLARVPAVVAGLEYRRGQLGPGDQAVAPAGYGDGPLGVGPQGQARHPQQGGLLLH